MKPSIGRIVHYTNLGDRDGKYPPEIQAAVITKVHEPKTLIGSGGITEELPTERDPVSLTIFYPTGVFMMARVERAPDNVQAGSDKARGHWQWPERT